MDFVKTVFDLSTYEGCEVVEDYKELDSLKAKGVRGTELTMIFTREINSDTFKVVLRVSAEIDGRRVLLHSGEELTPELITFWRKLSQMAYGNSDKLREAVRERAMAVLANEHKKPAKKK